MARLTRVPRSHYGESNRNSGGRARGAHERSSRSRPRGQGMRVVCDNCGATYRIPDEKLVKEVNKATCRKCGHRMLIRRPTALTEDVPPVVSAEARTVVSADVSSESRRTASPIAQPVETPAVESTPNEAKVGPAPAVRAPTAVGPSSSSESGPLLGASLLALSGAACAAFGASGSAELLTAGIGLAGAGAGMSALLVWTARSGQANLLTSLLGGVVIGGLIAFAPQLTEGMNASPSASAPAEVDEPELEATADAEAAPAAETEEETTTPEAESSASTSASASTESTRSAAPTSSRSTPSSSSRSATNTDSDPAVASSSSSSSRTEPTLEDTGLSIGSPSVASSSSSRSSSSSGRSSSGSSDRSASSSSSSSRSSSSSSSSSPSSSSASSGSTGGSTMTSLPLSVIDTMLRNNSGVKKCFGSFKSTNGYLPPRASVRFTVQRSGSVSGVSLKESDLKNTMLDRCLRTAVGGIRFPSFTGDPLTLTYPFVFQ